MNHISTRTFSTLVLGLILLSALAGCMQAGPPPLTDGQVIQMQVGSTWYGITGALQSAPGTKLMSNGNQVAAIWNAGEAWCVAFLNADSQKPLKEFIDAAGGKGGAMNAKTMSELVTWMEEKGWKVIAPAALPSRFAVFLNVTKEAFMAMAKSLPTPVIIIPAGVMDMTADFLENYTGNDGKYY